MEIKDFIKKLREGLDKCDIVSGEDYGIGRDCGYDTEDVDELINKLEMDYAIYTK